MTSNLGNEKSKASSTGFIQSGYSDERKRTVELLKDKLRPEFLNRIDEIIVFDRLGEEDIIKIAEIMLSGLKERLLQNGITANFTKEAVAEIAKVGYDPLYGARPLRRAIQTGIEDMLAEKIIEGVISNNVEID
jgi:ATP-dependent Clp protease ATP-binding subunit ClpA